MNGYKLDLTAKTLTITKAFEDAIATGEGDEYVIYTKLMTDIPGLTVIRKSHKTPAVYHTKSGENFGCNQFKNLTYKNMEGFIKALPNNQGYLDAFNFLRNYGSLVQTSHYAVVREWFVAQFPEFRKNPLFYLYNQPKTVDIVPIIQKAEVRDQQLMEDKAKEKKPA